MTCREVIEFLAEYLSGELPSGQRAVFDEHLRACPRCDAYLKSYRETVKLGRAMLGEPDDGVPYDVPPQLVEAILAARRTRR